MRAREGMAVARRYAGALLDVAGAQAEAMRTELEALVALTRRTPALAAALAHPALGVDRKRALVAEIARAGGASALLQRLLDLLAQRGRLALLPQLAEAYAEALRARQGVVRAEVETAVPLEDPQRQALAAALGQAAGRRAVDVQARVDPALMGGVLVRMGGRTYDGTVRGRLRALRARLSGRAAGGPA